MRPRQETRTAGTCLLVALREWESAAFRSKRRVAAAGANAKGANVGKRRRSTAAAR